MALFKILKGKSANLPANKVNGYCYVTTDEHKLYVDYTKDDGTLDRFALNAVSADQWKTARNLNGMVVNGTSNVVNYGTCSTAAATAAKVVSCSNFALITGAEITVKFTTTNTAANPTLNVNSTGAKAIHYRGSTISAGYLAANRTYTFRYNGSQYDLVGDLDTNTTYGSMSIDEGTTGTATTNRVLTATNLKGIINAHAPTKTGNGASGTWGINISGNAATATKLATARTISLTGSVTGSGSFDGSGNLSIATTTNHTHSYLPLSGGTMTGTLQFSDNIGLKGLMAGGSDWWELKGTGADDAGVLELAVGDNATSDYFDIIFKDCSGTNTRAIRFGGAEIHAYVPLYGAVWNDYAEFRICNEEFKPGQVVLENGDDTLSIASKRLQRGCSIVSDTFGFAIGETDEAKCPIAVSGRVLAYGYESREEFKNHIGWPVCSGPNGTVSIMTEEEEEKYPSRIIGTISAVPDYETWGTGNVSVDGRIWIKVV